MIDVLLIEDNDDDIELSRRSFEKAGLLAHLRVARDGEDALDYLFGRGAYASQGVASSIQLVLLDLNLPQMPGLEVLRQIRMNKETRALPVVVLTISRQEPDLLQGFTMGISDYLIKPIDQGRFSKMYKKYVKAVSA